MSTDQHPRVTMPFGKHRGKPLGEVPQSYLFWLLDDADLRPALRQAIELVLFGDRDGYDAGRADGIREALTVVKTWHRRAAITHHPDHGGDRKTMAIVNNLRDELVQPKKSSDIATLLWPSSTICATNSLALWRCSRDRYRPD